MNTHPYLRAYMAGITIPTILLLVPLTVFCVARLVYDFPVPVERVIVFPMAVVPNLWGIWNMLYVLLRSRRQVPIGLHGAVLPLLLAPLAFAVTTLLEFPLPGFVATVFPIALPIAIAVYYLFWKHVVGFFNNVLGIA